MGTNYYLRPKLAATVKTYIDGAVVESRRDYSEPRLYLAALPDGFTGEYGEVEGPDDFIERVEGHADGYEQRCLDQRCLDKGREVRARSHRQYGDWPDESGVRVEWSGYEFR